MSGRFRRCDELATELVFLASFNVLHQNDKALLIVADDLSKQLGCYGDQNILTPNIGNLASLGTRFDLAFASTASCSGSRSTIYTGLHTHTNGQYALQHNRHHFMTHDHIATLPKLFNGAGFLTGIIGKVDVGPDHVYPWTIRKDGGGEYRDVRGMADEAAAFLTEAKRQQKPWHLTLGYHDPHRDHTRGGFGNIPDYPGVEDIIYEPAAVQVPNYLLDLPQIRTELAEYYRSISRLDQGVGMLMKELQKSGFADDTVVLFVSDNGAPFVNSKTTLYDAGVCLPLIVTIPHGAVATSSAMVSFVDILPTLLDYCGVSSPTTGRSMVPLLTHPSDGTPPDWSEVYGSHTFHGVTEYYPTRFFELFASNAIEMFVGS